MLSLQALIATPDGATVHRDTREGPVNDAAAIGNAAGAALRAAGGPDFFDAEP
jgi:hydroxymethylbilane synthase